MKINREYLRNVTTIYHTYYIVSYDVTLKIITHLDKLQTV